MFQAFTLLRIGFTVAPILFGLDKFLDWLVDWQQYLAPEINDLVPGNAHQAMLAVGVIEIVAGLARSFGMGEPLGPELAAQLDGAVACIQALLQTDHREVVGRG